MPEGSPARTVVAAALLIALGAGAFWGVLQWRSATGEPASQAADPQPATPTSSPPPSSTPSPDPEDSSSGADSPPPAPPAPEPDRDASPEPGPEDADEEEGPATGPYAAFSPSHQLTHPDTDPDIRRWYDWFGYFVGDEVGVPSGEWTNKDELWDELAPALQEEAASMGPAVTEPQFPGMEVIPAVANVRWSNDDTKGRGEFVEFSIVYESNAEVVERYHAVLVVTDSNGLGAVHRRMEPFELRASEYRDFRDLRKASAERQWDWIMKQRVPKASE